jgi:hypothetical protein
VLDAWQTHLKQNGRGFPPIQVGSLGRTVRDFLQ